MTKLQAAMKDNSAKGWVERRVMYKVGSCFKGCAHCGDVEVEVLDNGRERKRWKTGMSVYRSYHPKQVGWTYICWDCTAKDEKCWEGAKDIGMDPILGTRSAIANIKAARRREEVGNERAMVRRHPTRADEIADLERQVEELMAQLRGSRK